MMPSVLIIGGGRWSNVYINEIIALPYQVNIDVVSVSQGAKLVAKYGNKINNYYTSCQDVLLVKSTI